MSEVQSCQARNLDRFRPLIAARATRTTSGWPILRSLRSLSADGRAIAAATRFPIPGTRLASHSGSPEHASFRQFSANQGCGRPQRPPLHRPMPGCLQMGWSEPL